MGENQKYWETIRERTCTEIGKYYGWNKDTLADVIFWVFSLCIIFLIDFGLRGLSQALGELYAFLIYFFGTGIVLLTWRYSRMFFTQPKVLDREKNEKIQSLEEELEDVYSNTDIEVKQHTYEKEYDDQWVGLEVKNNEIFDIEYFEIQAIVIDSSGKNVGSQFTIDWSGKNPPNQSFILKRTSSKLFDLAFSATEENKIRFVGLGGKRFFERTEDSFEIFFQVNGSIKGRGIKPIKYKCSLNYEGSDKLFIGEIERVED